MEEINERAPTTLNNCKKSVPNSFLNTKIIFSIDPEEVLEMKVD
jgi:hypothetical protein